MTNYNRIERKNEDVKRSLGLKSMIIALIIISFGIVLMLKNIGVIDNEIQRIIFSWPSLIIVIGLLNLNGRTKWLGFILIIFGGFFLLGNFYEDFQFSRIFWPLLIIIAGISIIISSSKTFKNRRFSVGSSNENKIEEVSIFGGSERIINAEAFEGGEIVNIFGGSKLDFRRSKLAEGTNELSFINVFGGSTIAVPSDWNIKTEIISIFGGFADKRFNAEVNQSKTLIIKGVAIFGGGEIKN